MSDLRRQILDASRRLIIDQGYHSLPMRSIAEAVGVSKAALYYHFRDKEQLLLAILDSTLDDMEAGLVELDQEPASTPEKIRRLINMILSQPAETRAVIRLASQEMANLSQADRLAFNQAYQHRFLGRIQAIFEQGMQAGELRQVDPRLTTWALLGMMYPYFYPSHTHYLPPAAQVADVLADLILQGLLP